MTIGPAPICMWCTRFHYDDDEGLTCDAFLVAIPDEIIENEFDHRNAHPDDNGLQFDPEQPGDPEFDPFALDGADGGEDTAQ